MAKKKANVRRKVSSRKAANVGPTGVASGAAQRRVLNCVPSRDRDRDWTFDAAVRAGIVEAVGLDEIRPEVDLRHGREGWWAIGDQQQTGACVGWAVADSAIRLLLNIRDPSLTDRLSTRFMWMAAKETDEYTRWPETMLDFAGTSLKAALKIARDFGCVLESDLPTDPPRFSEDQPGVFYSKASQRRVGAYHATLELHEWKSALCQNRPIVIRVQVDQSWQNIGADGVLWVYNPFPPEIAPRDGTGHAAAVVGYVPRGPDNEQHFIIRNSWGTDWGDNGYAYASPSYVRKAVSEAFVVSL